MQMWQNNEDIHSADMISLTAWRSLKFKQSLKWRIPIKDTFKNFSILDMCVDRGFNAEATSAMFSMWDVPVLRMASNSQAMQLNSIVQIINKLILSYTPDSLESLYHGNIVASQTMRQNWCVYKHDGALEKYILGPYRVDMGFLLWIQLNDLYLSCRWMASQKKYSHSGDTKRIWTRFSIVEYDGLYYSGYFTYEIIKKVSFECRSLRLHFRKP